MRIRSSKYLTVLLAAASLAAASCSTSKYLRQGEVRLAHENISVRGSGLSDDDFETFIRQRPNTKVFAIFPLRLWMYNMSSDKDTRVNRWLRRVGEPPVVFDSSLVGPTIQHIKQYAAYRGYYGATADVDIRYHGKKARVSYDVNLGAPLRIRHIRYVFADKHLDTTFVTSSNECLIGEGNVFDSDVLKKERHRIAEGYRTRGYYYFNDDQYISYLADTTVGEREVDITVEVAQFQASPDSKLENHRQYYIGSLIVNPEYSPDRALSDTAYMRTRWDTIHRRAFDMICQSCTGEKQQPNIKPKVFAINSRVAVGDLYNEQDVVNTYSNLADLQQFRSYNLRFSVMPDSARPDSIYPDPNVRPLRGTMLLTPLKSQNMSFGGEVSISGNGLFGAMGSANYQHRNLFHGAEILNVGVMGSFQRVQIYADADPQNAYEAEVTLGLTMPKFPFNAPMRLYRIANSPRSRIALRGNYQQRPDYTRALASLTFGVSWRSPSSLLMYEFNPIDMDLINVMNITDNFAQSIATNPYMLNSYRNTFLLGSTSSITYDSRRRDKRSHTRRLLYLGVELKGNLLWLGYKAFDVQPKEENERRQYMVLNTQFAQFAKFDALYTRHTTINSRSSVAARALLGMGFAYGNSMSLPFDKMYYCGGANSMRGWQVRMLGPGSFTTDTTNLLNHLADMRMEANVEYRFKLFWKMEGALFLDAGNIWSIRESDSKKLFSLKTFLPQIAINWGLGLRANFSDVVVLRLDYGIRLHDPAIASPYFISPKTWFANGVNTLFLALSYPF